MRLSMLTSIGFCATMALDQRRAAPFNFEDIYRASDERKLVDLLRGTIDDSGIIALWANTPKDKESVETALNDAAEALRGRELRKVGVGDNPLCMVIAIIMEAIQQNY